MRALGNRFIAFENMVHQLLVRHSITVLRWSVGLVFLGFGLLKYFPGVSPAERLATDTTDVLFLGLIPPEGAIYIVATMECFIGICFLIGTGALMRVAIWVLAAQLVGILSPLLLDPERLFSGPNGAPTLEGQYVLKDIILVAAGMVIAAGTFRGGRMVRDEPQVDTAGQPDAEREAPSRDGARQSESDRVDEGRTTSTPGAAATPQAPSAGSGQLTIAISASRPTQVELCDPGVSRAGSRQSVAAEAVAAAHGVRASRERVSEGARRTAAARGDRRLREEGTAASRTVLATSVRDPAAPSRCYGSRL